jgi:hypothetical protein
MNDDPPFSPQLWHDNAIHGVRLELGDPSSGDWRSELVLDIDHIVEWLCQPGQTPQLRVAPATLTFFAAGDLQISLDCGDSAGQVALHELSIDRIERQPIVPQRVPLDPPFYRWSIELNWPQGGFIRFAARHHRLSLRGPAHLCAGSRLPPALRNPGQTATP